MAQGKTKKIAISAAAKIAITAIGQTPSVQIREDPTVGGYPTTPFNVYKPTSADDGERIAIGASYTFTKGLGHNYASMYMPGEVVGYADLPSGSTTIVQDEV